MTRTESVRHTLDRQTPGTRIAVLQIQVYRGRDGYDLWAPGHCPCGPVTHPGLSLQDATQQILAWRPERAR